MQVRLRALRELEYVATARVHAVVKPHRFYGGGPAITDEGKAQRADDVVASAERGLSSIPSWVPRRICDEEIGDALEYIAAVSRRGAPGWERDVRRKVWSTKLWVLCNAVREVVRAALGKQGA